MVTWGLVTVATAAVHNGVTLTVSRLLLDVAEAGFSPAMMYFVSCCFPKNSLANLSGWRWLFILSGIPAIGLGIVCYRVMRDSPAQATFLPEQEKTWLQDTLAADMFSTPSCKT